MCMCVRNFGVVVSGVSFNPSVNFKAVSSSVTESPAAVSAPVKTNAAPQKTQKNNKSHLKIGNIFIATSSVLKALIYGFLTGTAVAAYNWATKAIPNSAKNGKSLIETLRHPAKSIGWKGNLFAGVAALGVATYHIMRGKIKAEQRSARLDNTINQPVKNELI